MIQLNGTSGSQTDGKHEFGLIEMTGERRLLWNGAGH